MPRYIREGRFGKPKAYKTGAVLSSYPRPLLSLAYDRGEAGGTSVIREPISFLKPDEAMALCKNGTPAPLSVIDFTVLSTALLTDAYVPRADRQTLEQTVKVINALFERCPWKTVVLDTVTGLSDACYSHQSATNASVLADARKWAGNIGMKVKQIIEVLQLLKCHTVVIFHSEVDKNELNLEIREVPMVYSKLREFLGAIFDQFVYATIRDGKPILLTQSQGLTQGIGCRWPHGLKPVVGPYFEDLYGEVKKELL